MCNRSLVSYFHAPLCLVLLLSSAVCAGEAEKKPEPAPAPKADKEKEKDKDKEAKAETTAPAKDPYGAPAAPAAPAKKGDDGAVPLPVLTKAMQHMKMIPVGPTKVSFGMDHQTRVEVWDNKFIGKGRTYTNGLTFFRTRLWMDWDLHKHVRVFVEGQDSRKDGDIGTQKRFWEDKPDLLEGYIDLRNLFNEDLTIRIGRQGLVYGKQRLVGTFEWSNTGRRFDAIRVFWNSKDKDWSADAFASKVVVIDPEGFDEQHPTEEFYGLHATYNGVKNHHFDMYTFARLDDNNRIPDELHNPTAQVPVISLGDLDIYTHGFRAWGGKFFGGLDYEVEAAFQWGTVGRGDHLAGAAHAEAGWTFSPSWKPRLMAEYNFGSGDDDPADGDNNAFNNLFPTNHLHYGYSDYVNWSNTHNIAVGFTAVPYRGITVWTKYHQFWLADRNDGWRNAAGAVLGRDKTGNSGSSLGCEFDVGVSAKINKHINAQIGYSIFDGSEFLLNTRPGNGETSQFFWAQAGISF